MHQSGIQLESEFGMGPEFVLSTDTGLNCGCDILRESEQFCQVKLPFLTYWLLLFNAKCVTTCTFCKLQANSAVIDKADRGYNSIHNGKPPIVILLGNL